MSAPVLWPEHASDALRTLWETDLTAAAIGAQLGYSKNAVLGKVHRLHLAPRAVMPQPPPPPPRGAAELAEAHRRSLARKPQKPPKAPPKPAAPVPAVVRTCQWPTGEPRTKGFRFCDAPALAGCPYCAVHVRLAYVRRPVSRLEAAA
jgi:GcrA cell cycle regulator